jgi:hypothetical protein
MVQLHPLTIRSVALGALTVAAGSLLADQVASADNRSAKLTVDSPP